MSEDILGEATELKETVTPDSNAEYYRVESFQTDNTIITREKNRIHFTKKIFQLPFMLYIVLLTFLLLLISIIWLIVVYNKYEEYYKFYDKDVYLKPKISNHNYSKLVFDNGIEIVLIQVNYDDTAAGVLSFDTGYLDLKYDPGLLKLALLSMKNTNKKETTELEDYMGSINQVHEEFYSTIYITILNSGFQKYLKNFQDYTAHFNEDNITETILQGFKNFKNYPTIVNSVNDREKYLIEFLVYNITDKNGKDVNRQGDLEVIRNMLIDNPFIMFEPLGDLFNTRKTKLLFASHYKMSLMKKFILRYLRILVHDDNSTTIPSDKANEHYSEIITNKIIYHQIKENENNYIKINYYVSNDKINLEQLYIDSGYFNYLKYILDETNEDSLYYNLTHPEDNQGINIKSLSCNFEVVLKRKIRFTIEIKLNHYSYNHIKKIIEIVYDYMEKIKSHINNLKPDDERVRELFYINEQNFTFTEDVHSDEFYKNKAKDLFYRNSHDYYLKEVWIPPALNKNKTNISFYTNQLTINNSVVIIGISDYTKDKYNLSQTDIGFIFNEINTTKYFNIKYSIHDLKKLNININNNNVSELVYHKNEFISNYSSSYTVPKGEKQNYEKFELLSNNNELVKLYWIYDTSYQLPKVFINFYLFHPFQRPNFKMQNENDEMFFHLMMYISYMQREKDLILADAIRAGNIIKIGIGENYLYIDVFAFPDVIKNILKIIKEKVIPIRYDNIKDNYMIYRDNVLEDLLNRDTLSNILKFDFFRYLTMGDDNFPPYYNQYSFPKTEYKNFNKLNRKYIDSIKSPIYHIFLMGYYNKDESLELYNLYNANISLDHFKDTLDLANYTMDLSVYDFVNKTLYKPDLKGIKKNTNYTYITDNTTYIFKRFFHYSDLNMVPFDIFKKIIEEEEVRNISVEFFNQFDIYIKMSFPNDAIYTVESVQDELIKIMNKAKNKMMEEKDIFGGRYYYLIKNYEIQHTINNNDLQRAALDISYNQIYNRLGAETYKLNDQDYEDFTKIIEGAFRNNKDYYEFSNKHK